MATVNTAQPFADQINLNTGTGGNGEEVSAQLMTATFSYTVAAAGQDDYTLVRLPAGKVKIYPQLSFIAVSQGVATADFHLGHRAYRTAAGAVVAEDDNEWLDNVDIGGGAISGIWSAVAGFVAQENVEFDAVDGLRIFGTVDTANQDLNDTVTGWVTYSKASG
jgi:hypothetical protein